MTTALPTVADLRTVGQVAITGTLNITLRIVSNTDTLLEDVRGLQVDIPWQQLDDQLRDRLTHQALLALLALREVRP